MPSQTIKDLSREPAGADELARALHAIDEGLSDFNASTRPDLAAGPLVLVAQDETGAIVGGLRGRIAYGWLRIDVLWVAEPMRGRGYGSMLLAAAERTAISRRCHSVHLDTHGFQAPDFYRAHGYDLFAQLDDYPEGESHYYFKKHLSDA